MAYSEQIAFADLCDDMQNSANEQGLQESLSRFVRRNGFEWFAYIAKTATEAYGHASYPIDWQTQYVEQDFVSIDPVLVGAQRSALPFTWSAEQFQGQRRERQFFGAAADFNIRNGVVIPIAGVYGSFISVSLAGSYNDNQASAQSENLPYLTLGALHYHMQVTRMREEAQRTSGTDVALVLSPKARSCLMWIARGKTIEDTGDILQIHEATVRYHLNDARRRLNAHSLPHLVAEALRRGEISF